MASCSILRACSLIYTSSFQERNRLVDRVRRSHVAGCTTGSTPPSAQLFRTSFLELPSIGWQLFILGSSPRDQTALPSLLATYTTRLLTEPLSSSGVR